MATTVKKKPTIFDPQAPPHVLWMMPLKKRKINVAGALSPGVLGPGTGEDALIGIAAGAQPGFPMYDMEYRATILGALATLKAAGLKPYSKRHFEKLTANVVGSKPLNDQILAAAGQAGKTLSTAAANMQRVVAKYGKGLATAAWGARGIALLANLKAFQTARAAVVIGIQFIPVVGQIVGAAASAHGAISAAIAKGEIVKLSSYIKAGLASYRKAELAKASKATSSESKTSRVQEAISIPQVPATNRTLYWILGGTALLAVVVILARRKRTTLTRAIA